MLSALLSSSPEILNVTLSAVNGDEVVQNPPSPANAGEEVVGLGETDDDAVVVGEGGEVGLDDDAVVVGEGEEVAGLDEAGNDEVVVGEGEEVAGLGEADEDDSEVVVAATAFVTATLDNVALEASSVDGIDDDGKTTVLVRSDSAAVTGRLTEGMTDDEGVVIPGGVAFAVVVIVVVAGVVTINPVDVHVAPNPPRVPPFDVNSTCIVPRANSELVVVKDEVMGASIVGADDAGNGLALPSRAVAIWSRCTWQAATSNTLATASRNPAPSCSNSSRDTLQRTLRIWMLLPSTGQTGVVSGSVV
eukprot:3941774-Rhodomonas_salina.2